MQAKQVITDEATTLHALTELRVQQFLILIPTQVGVPDVARYVRMIKSTDMLVSQYRM